MVSRTPRVNWSKYIPNDVFSLIKTTFFNGVRLQGFALEHTIIFANDECVMGTWRQAWPCRGYSVRPVNLHERAGTPLHGYSQRHTVHKASCVKFRMERMDPNETRCKEKIAQANIWIETPSEPLNFVKQWAQESILNLTINEISSTKLRRSNRNAQGSQRSWAQGAA